MPSDESRSGPEWSGRDTVAVRAGLRRSGFDETAEALYLTSGYVYASAEEAEAAFDGETDHFIYSRYGNPTVAMFQDRLAALEGAEACWATATGMAAVFYSLISLLRQGDRVVSSRDLFGSCFMILTQLLPRWGIETEFVDGADLAEWERALTRPANVVFFESPSNPMLSLVDIARVSDLAHAAGAQVVVDNVFATPVFQRPLELGADVVTYSTTKHIDGQGRTLGGAILGTERYAEETLKPFMRHTGPAMSPFNAWILVKSLETMSLRVRRMADTALELASWLQGHVKVRRVWHPFLESHPQHQLALEQMDGGGTIVTFEVDGGKPEAFRLLNGLATVDISNNLGDSKSLVTHPATTTHKRIGPEARAAMGINDGIVRVSVGLEDVEDLRDDLAAGLAGI